MRTLARKTIVAVMLLSVSSQGEVASRAQSERGANAAADQHSDGPSVHYHVTYGRGVGAEGGQTPSDGGNLDWHVTIEARGLADAAQPIRLVLSDWGEWTDVDSYYLRAISIDPPAAPAADARNAWLLDPPSNWDGVLRVEYTIATTTLGSQAMERHGLLPWRAPSYVIGYSSNTLMRIEAGDLEPVRTLEIDVPDEWTIATGAGGVSIGSQRCALPDGYENGVISFGRPVATWQMEDDRAPIEIVQWGGEPGVVEKLGAFAHDYVTLWTETLQLPPTGPIRLIVTEPGHGGTRTDGAISIGCPAAVDGAADPYTLHFLAHEIFHDWLGGRLKPKTEGESLAWFWEGFTEYLSLRGLTKAGLVDREWFASRIGDFENAVARNEHWRDTMYADPGVNWRDSSMEPLAYSGGALLAFELDVRLRRAGRAGVSELLVDLAALPDGRYALDDIERWLEDHGQGEYWRDVVAGTTRPDIRAGLTFAGFDERTVPAPLTYLGVRLRDAGSVGAIEAIDPDGPAAGSGLEVGDVVIGRTPIRHEQVTVRDDFDTLYPFGLTLYDPAATSCGVHVQRGGDEVMVHIKPRIIQHGRATVLDLDRVRLDQFFR